jgi:opacity protein-like surface antigen
MVRKLWGGAGVVAAVLATAGSAWAADLAIQAPVYKAPPVILSDWSGFYIGAHGGYGWGGMSFDPTDDTPSFVPTNQSNANLKGGVFGGQAGYNWQYGSVVTGLEVDFSGADISGPSVGIATSPLCLAGGPPCPTAQTVSQQVKFDALASARARLGYTVLPNLLAYGTGGLGLGHSTVTEVVSAGQTLVSSTDASAVDFGWVAGGGLEYKLWDHVIVRAEYLHYDFLKATYSAPNPISTTATSTVDVVRGGVSYKF